MIQSLDPLTQAAEANDTGVEVCGWNVVAVGRYPDI